MPSTCSEEIMGEKRLHTHNTTKSMFTPYHHAHLVPLYDYNQLHSSGVEWEDLGCSQRSRSSQTCSGWDLCWSLKFFHSNLVFMELALLCAQGHCHVWISFAKIRLHDNFVLHDVRLDDRRTKNARHVLIWQRYKFDLDQPNCSHSCMSLGRRIKNLSIMVTKQHVVIAGLWLSHNTRPVFCSWCFIQFYPVIVNVTKQVCSSS